MPQDPSDEEIRTRAYDLYLRRGERHGSDVDDWLRAERELRGGTIRPLRKTRRQSAPDPDDPPPSLGRGGPPSQRRVARATTSPATRRRGR